MTTHEQWDATTGRLVDFAAHAEYERLPADVVHECKRRLIDTFASAMGAYDEPVSQMARTVASRTRGDDVASVWGSDIKTTPEAAAFANGVMVRLLDISDTYLGKNRGHPSDMTSGILAVAENIGADGKAVINAVTLAYDIYCSFCDAVEINDRGWDQPVYVVLGCVLGIAKLLRLNREQTANAVSLALAPNMALSQSRRGHLSVWKGCAGANASRNAVFAAMLAKDGFTGPTAVFEGEGGLWQAIGVRFDWPLPERTHMIGQTHIKGLPVCYHGQSSVWAALELRKRVAADDIGEIEVDTYKTAVAMMGGDPSRWAPTTRETADHSLPYCVSVALVDGKVVNESFAESRLTDPAIVNLMRKVKVREDEKLSAFYPQGSPCRVTIRAKTGAEHTLELQYPKGHAKTPMSDSEVEAKYRDMVRTRLRGKESDALLKALWSFDTAGNIRDVIALVTR